MISKAASGSISLIYLLHCSSPPWHMILHWKHVAIPPLDSFVHLNIRVPNFPDFPSCLYSFSISLAHSFFFPTFYILVFPTILIKSRLSLCAVDSPNFRCIYLIACWMPSYFMSAQISTTKMNLPPSILNFLLFVNVTIIQQNHSCI